MATLPVGQVVLEACPLEVIVARVEGVWSVQTGYVSGRRRRSTGINIARPADERRGGDVYVEGRSVGRLRVTQLVAVGAAGAVAQIGAAARGGYWLGLGLRAVRPLWAAAAVAARRACWWGAAS